MSPRTVVVALCVLLAFAAAPLALPGAAAAFSSSSAPAAAAGRSPMPSLWTIVDLQLLAGAMLAAVAVFSLPVTLVRERPWVPLACLGGGAILPLVALGVCWAGSGSDDGRRAIRAAVPAAVVGCASSVGLSASRAAARAASCP